MAHCRGADSRARHRAADSIMAEAKSQPAWRSVTAMQADNFCGIFAVFAGLILWHKASGFVIARAFAILTKPCANREFCAGHGCPLPYRARALLSRRIQKSDRLIWASRSGFSDYGASSSPPVDSVGASVGGSVGSGSVGFSVGLSVGLSVGSVGASVGGSVSSTSLATRRLRQS